MQRRIGQGLTSRKPTREKSEGLHRFSHCRDYHLACSAARSLSSPTRCRPRVRRAGRPRADFESGPRLRITGSPDSPQNARVALRSNDHAFARGSQPSITPSAVTGWPSLSV
jgi:hypothetical protein